MSVVVPVRDEVPAAIAEALASVAAQDYGGRIEVVVADGSGVPAAAPPGVRVVANPAGGAAAGLNAAVAAASHDIVVRCDGRCVLPPDYVRTAVRTLERTGAANVGGRQRPVGRTPFERAVALAMTTPLGAGDARYRLGGAAGPVDTVFLGVFRRAALEAAGGFDETLLKNQDYELNWRLRRAGGTVWFDPALGVAYRPRGSLAALARQYHGYGRWKRVVARRHPRSLRWRQLAAPLLALGLAASAAGAVAAAFAEPARGVLAVAAAAAPGAYALVLLAGSAAVGARRRDRAALRLPLVLATMHLAWGSGFLRGAGRAGR